MTLVTLLFSLLVGTAAAQPEVTGADGDRSHGGSLTITGSGFGTKSLAAPYFFTDFESGTLGDTVQGHEPLHGPAVELVNVGGPALPGTFDDANARQPRSTRHAYLDANPDEGNWGVRLEFPIDRTSGERLYVRFWLRSLFADGIPGDDLNQKPYDIYSSAFRPLIYIGWGDSSRSLRTGGDASSPTQWLGDPLYTDVHDEWVGYEEEIHVGDGTSGSRRAWIHEVSAPRITLAWDEGAMSTWISGEDYGAMTIGEYFRSGPMEYWIDEIYVDYSWARVELGDAPSWDACTRREIQIPSAWSDAEIVVITNLGAFEDCSIVFLYVVDEDGARNAAGFPFSTPCSGADGGVGPGPDGGGGGTDGSMPRTDGGGAGGDAGGGGEPDAGCSCGVAGGRARTTRLGVLVGTALALVAIAVRRRRRSRGPC